VYATIELIITFNLHSCTLFTWGSATDFTACKGSAATKRLKNTGLSQQRMAKLYPSQIWDLSIVCKKIWNRWLRPRDDPLAKFCANPSIWASRQRSEI